MSRSLIITVLSILLAIHSVPAQENAARLWKDTSGKFQVRARLIGQDATVVRLHTDDGRELKVPIERLSEADQEYLKLLAAPKDNPFAGGTPVPGATKVATAPAAAVIAGTFREQPKSQSAGDQMALPGTGTTLDLSSEMLDQPFAPDPVPASPPLRSAVVPVSPVDAYDKVSTPVIASAADGTCLVSIGRNMAGRPQEARGRIYTVSLAEKSAILVWDFPRCVRVLDHDLPSGRTLIVDQLDHFQRGGELVMVEGLITGTPKPLFHRSLPGAGKPGFAPQVEWARLLSSSHVAAIVDRVLYVWDLPAAALVYRVEDVQASEPPVFSGNQRYMAIPQGGKVVVVDTISGAVRRTVTTGSTLRPGVAFHPDGHTLAICFSNQYLVWDCQDGTTISQATTTDHLGSYPILWIAPKMFRSALGDAVHLDLGMSVWKYTASAMTEPAMAGSTMLTATTSQKCELVNVAIPHAAVEKSIDQLVKAGDSAMLVRPGSAVSIAIETNVGEVDHGAIQAGLTEAAEKAGWKVSDKAPIALVAKIGRGQTQQLNFRNLRGGGQTSSTASLTPFTAELEIRRDSTVLWKRSTENRIPSLLRLEEGETVQDAVKRYEKPDPMFFARLNLPPRIPKPEITQQVGQSVLRDGQWQDMTARPVPPRRR